ncbi:MAG: hypothetical protein JKY48_06910 [Flavobacteriales bacterium]|nr:hypothetical protein [Flavobacteriales bacterium]
MKIEAPRGRREADRDKDRDESVIEEGAKKEGRDRADEGGDTGEPGERPEIVFQEVQP